MFVALKKKKLSWSIEDKKLSVGNDDFEGARTNGGRRRGRREVFVRCFFHKMHRRLCYFPLFFVRLLHPSYVLVRWTQLFHFLSSSAYTRKAATRPDEVSSHSLTCSHTPSDSDNRSSADDETFLPPTAHPEARQTKGKKVCAKSEKTFSLHPCVRAAMGSLWRWHLTRTRLRLIILNMMFHTNGATLGSAIKFIWMLYRIACTIHITFRCLWT